MAASVPDLVVLDLRLPDVPGADVLRGIRANPRSAETPVVVIMAHPQMAQEVADFNSWEEADLVLVKHPLLRGMMDYGFINVDE